jgi:hypothetical protein
VSNTHGNGSPPKTGKRDVAAVWEFADEGVADLACGELAIAVDSRGDRGITYSPPVPLDGRWYLILTADPERINPDALGFALDLVIQRHYGAVLADDDTAQAAFAEMRRLQDEDGRCSPQSSSLPDRRTKNPARTAPAIRSG